MHDPILQETGTSELQRQPFKKWASVSYIIKQEGTSFLTTQLPLWAGFYFKGALTTRPLQPQIYSPILCYQALLAHLN